MENEEYQVLIRRPGAEAARAAARGRRRRRAATTSPGTSRDVPDDDLPSAHRRPRRARPGRARAGLPRGRRRAGRGRPSIFAYTIKGWRLPFAGDSLNHSAHARRRPGRAARARPRDRPGRRLGRLRARLAGGPRWRRRRRAELGYDDAARPDRRPERRRSPMPDVRIGPADVSTQQAFGDTLAALARDPEIGGRIVTAAPDVAVSTNLGGWINRAGVFSPRRRPGPSRRHQRPLGLGAGAGRPPHRARHQRDEPVPVAQPVRAVRASCSASGWRPSARSTTRSSRAAWMRSSTRSTSSRAFVLVGTPSGVTLAPEGGAHQSTVTPSLGIELPGLRGYEPVFAPRGRVDAARGHPRLPRPGRRVRHVPAARRPGRSISRSPSRSRRGSGEDGWRDGGAGGWLPAASRPRRPRSRCPPAARSSRSSPSGTIVPEAVEAVRRLHREEIAANLIVVTLGGAAGGRAARPPARRRCAADRARRRRAPRRRSSRPGSGARRS